MIITNCRRIVGGVAQGPALVTTQPINFLAMVEPKSGKITDPKHDLNGKSVKGSVLVFPYAVGSSVGAYVIYSLKEYGCAPSAVVCLKADITTASGCAIANIPTMDLPAGTALGSINPGSLVRVDASAERATVTI